MEAADSLVTETAPRLWGCLRSLRGRSATASLLAVLPWLLLPEPTESGENEEVGGRCSAGMGG